MSSSIVSLVPAKPAKRRRARTERGPTGLLSRREEEILQTVCFYRYMTTRDITAAHFSPNSETHVRKILSFLCGGVDDARDQYLYRFQLPQTGPGNSQKVFTLGSRGREFLVRDVGLPVDWYFRPRKVRNASYGAMLHNLVLTRFLVAARHWTANCSIYNLVETQTGYEIASRLRAQAAGQMVPDAWLLFEGLQGGVHTHFAPVLLEIDRGTEYKKRFQDHIRARVEFVRSGAYRTLFGTEKVTIAYATAGETLTKGQARRRSMCDWAKEALAQLHMERWAANFRFTSVAYEALYQLPLFVAPMWYRPGEGRPCGLFDPV